MCTCMQVCLCVQVSVHMYNKSVPINVCLCICHPVIKWWWDQLLSTFYRTVTCYHHNSRACLPQQISSQTLTSPPPSLVSLCGLLNAHLVGLGSTGGMEGCCLALTWECVWPTDPMVRTDCPTLQLIIQGVDGTKCRPHLFPVFPLPPFW